jgi:hypothetical protein
MKKELGVRETPKSGLEHLFGLQFLYPGTLEPSNPGTLFILEVKNA